VLRGCYRVDADPGDPPADLNLHVTADARVEGLRSMELRAID